MFSFKPDQNQAPNGSTKKPITKDRISRRSFIACLTTALSAPLAAVAATKKPTQLQAAGTSSVTGFTAEQIKSASQLHKLADDFRKQSFQGSILLQMEEKNLTEFSEKLKKQVSSMRKQLNQVSATDFQPIALESFTIIEPQIESWTKGQTPTRVATKLLYRELDFDQTAKYLNVVGRQIASASRDLDSTVKSLANGSETSKQHVSDQTLQESYIKINRLLSAATCLIERLESFHSRL